MILVLGGTSDSIEICKKLNENSNIDYILSVTTIYGEDIARKHADKVILGKLSKEDMINLMKKESVSTIIDSTHPYAVEVSKNAIESCKEMDIDYLRYERKSLIEDIDYDNVDIVDSIEKACEIATEKGNNIFVGTGSKNLSQIVKLMPNKSLVVRVLPTSDVLSSCEKLGLNADNIIAMKGPFSQSINEEFYKHYNIDLVITKESGVNGGFLEKVNACKSSSIPIVIIKREVIYYPNLIDDISELEKLI